MVNLSKHKDILIFKIKPEFRKREVLKLNILKEPKLTSVFKTKHFPKKEFNIANKYRRKGKT